MVIPNNLTRAGFFIMIARSYLIYCTLAQGGFLMKQYLELCKHVLETGEKKKTAQGQGHSVSLVIRCASI